MTHTPPIPPGNQSPYPLVEPPHDHSSTSDTSAATAVDEEAQITTGLIVGGLAAGVAAIAAGVALWARRGKPKPRSVSAAAPPRAESKPATAKPKQRKAAGKDTAERASEKRRRSPRAKDGKTDH